MKRLEIYPTSRAIRQATLSLKGTDGFLPSFMRMDEFEHRAVLVDGKAMVDSISRILYLRRASKFEEFSRLKTDRDIVKFFTKSDAIFKFLEELSAEDVEFAHLMEADAYAEFGEHIAILELLKARYHKLLTADGLTDRMFLVDEYRLNLGFIESYDEIELHLEGYLSQYELKLLSQITTHTRVKIRYTTSRFNQKMIDRFAQYGVELPLDTTTLFDLSTGEIESSIRDRATIEASVYSVEQRVEQVSLAISLVQKLVDSGIAPTDIALILPDESFKEHLMLYDRAHNLNFAMGYELSDTRGYRQLEALQSYWQHPDKKHQEIAQRSSLDIEHIDSLPSSAQCGVGEFFSMLDSLALSKPTVTVEQTIEEKRAYLSHTLSSERLTPKEWLYIWLKILKSIKIDDTNGGLVTVMGVLETRGVAYEAVVIVDFNDGIVPASSTKDIFLNSQVRAFANLPTRADRESLQKQYYKRLLEQSRRAIIIYSSSDSRLPSKFLSELRLDSTRAIKPPLQLLYPKASQIVELSDPIVESFDARSIKWSPSRLKTYIECKRKYYYRYIKRLKSKPTDEPNEGTLLHSILEELYSQQSSYLDIDTITRELDRVISHNLPYDDSHSEYRRLLYAERLRGFAESQIEHFRAGWQVSMREYLASGDIGGLHFEGRIDRIDQDNQRTLIIDYKSGAVPKEPKNLNPEKISDFQMSIYRSLLESKFQNISLAYLKILENGELQEVSLLEEREELLHEHIVSLKQTKSFVATKTEELSRCRYCEFALLCERGDYL